MGAYLPVLISNLGKAMDKEVIIDLAIPLAKDVLPTLVNNIASNAVLNVINKFGRKISGKEVVRAWKRFTLFISNEDMNYIIKIAESL